MTFDRVVIVDWSAASKPSPARESADAIWIAEAAGGTAESTYLRTRTAAEDWLRRRIAVARGQGERLLIGADFAFGYPAGLAARLTGRAEALAVWEWLAGALEDGPDNRNNRLELAARINRTLPGRGPFWFNPSPSEIPGLPRRGRERHGYGPLAELRDADARARGAQSAWKLGGAGSVGSQVLTGLPVLWRLRQAGGVAAWPFEPAASAPIVLAEVFPSLLAPQIAGLIPAAAGKHDWPIRDAVQVRLHALALERLAAQDALAPLLEPDAKPEILREEGWILGLGHEAALRAAADAARDSALPPRPGGAGPRPASDELTPPRLRDDCFAMPQGVDWVPVDAALERLRAGLHPVTGQETVPVSEAAGRVLAGAPIAQRANPPVANAAVDGYGFARAATGAGVQRLPLLEGRAAAGQPYPGTVPPGHALRILTGAPLPDGVDTVVLEEDTASDGAMIAFDGPVRGGANTRRAGEDVEAGAAILPGGHWLRAPDVALLTALGVGKVCVRRRLRVAVVSTGDELRERAAAAHEIFDANRPMLRALIAGWGHAPLDLGVAPDDPGEIAARLDRGAREGDVIVTTGGASAGDEDHVSALMRARGQVSSWRIALKPGRPLMLGMWRGVPVFGMPGNPVAAMVCALIFARPALSVLAGAGWCAPKGMTVPAAFTKSKKPGRREYLRARLDAEGRAEVFASEGSGRISGLVWAEGLVELGDGAAEIAPGTPVRFIPYSAFGV